jgi:poly-gamma-glutamate capsule biosynthesis protein CapA/YwtB (metallophosphatase superfamily)
MQTVFRTETAVAAKTLSDTVEGLKQLAPFAIGQMAKGNAEKARLLRSVVGATRISAQGNELQITLALAEGDLAGLIQAF